MRQTVSGSRACSIRVVASCTICRSSSVNSAARYSTIQAILGRSWIIHGVSRSSGARSECLSAASRPPQVGHLWAGVVMHLSMVRAEAPVHTDPDGPGRLSKRVVSTGSDRPCRARPADRSLVAEDRSAGGVPRPDGAGEAEPSQRWSTIGPHAIGSERALAVSSGASFAQVADRIPRNRPGCRTLIRMRSQVQVLACRWGRPTRCTCSSAFGETTPPTSMRSSVDRLMMTLPPVAESQPQQGLVTLHHEAFEGQPVHDGAGQPRVGERQPWSVAGRSARGGGRRRRAAPPSRPGC
jgi:hypothetical protein